MLAQMPETCWNRPTPQLAKPKSPKPKWPCRYRSRFSEAFVIEPRSVEWEITEQPSVEHVRSELEKTFLKLARQWRDETWYISSIKKRVSHPAHLKIIGLGLPAVPLIIKEMRKSPDHWFWSLEAITREDPLPNPENLRQLADAWLAWADRHGY